MTDITTLAGQKARYAEIRARLWGSAEQKRVLIPKQSFWPTPEPSRMARLAQVEAEICVKHGITRTVLLGASRSAKAVRARQEYAYRLAMEEGLSMFQVGRRINRDHTTALHGVRVHMARAALPEGFVSVRRRQRDEAIAIRTKLILDQYEAGMSAVQIAQEYAGVSPETVRRTLKEAGKC